MKFQKYILSIAVALTAFGLGIGLIEIGQYLTAKPVPKLTQKEEVRTLTIEELRFPKANADPKLPETSPVTTPVTEQVETTEPEFYADGDYFIIGDLPKGFKDFDRLEIETTEYVSNSAKNDYKYVDFPPKGSIITTNEFNFKRISISEKRISFETESIKGISYKFVGKFINDEVENEYNAEYAFIKGTLTKIRDGKKIAEAKVEFTAGGC